MTSPALPPRYEQGQRFSIHLRSECWTRDDIERLGAHAGKAWLLELMGRAMDDRALAALPDLPHLEILELGAGALNGSELRQLARFDRLRIVRIRLDRNDDFSVPELPALQSLEEIHVANLPDRAWGSDRLLRALPRLSRLTLHARDDLRLDGECPSRLAHASFTAKRIAGSFRPPPRLDSLSLHLSQIAEPDLRAWLGGVERMRALHLRGTPITDALAETLPATYGLDYLELVDTGVSRSAIARIAAAHPSLKLTPALRTG